MRDTRNGPNVVPGHVPDVPADPDTGPGAAPPPERGPSGPRTPYPVDDPGVAGTDRPGSAPDVLPGRPLDPGTQI